ncbi:sugar nucleotide-binding protein [Kribbella sp. NPDC005582]|uniref:sugar nucleotide-binding protein n=1 Tax=Kribbella sp. NPDC005582 TaxID=3156893 RepID=UPI0033A024D4
MRILITGGNGLLGRELVRQCVATGHLVTATYFSQPGDADVPWRHLDVRANTEVRECLDSTRPDVVINTAYLRSGWATTADGAAQLAAAAAAVRARMIQVSSRAVFSGLAEVYDETSSPDPISAYGAAKAAAEVAVRFLQPNSVIARTSLIIGSAGDSDHERLVHMLAAGAPGALFTDEIICAVHVADLAAALLELAEGERTGVHHLDGPDAISRYELGLLIAERDGLAAGKLQKATRVGRGIPGPVRVVLDSTSTQQHLRTRLRGAREFLRP